MDISLIKPYQKNAKKHDKKQIKQVADSIKEFGFNQPLVVDKDNTVIVGHGRLEAAKLLRLTDVPVITVDLTEEQAKAYRLADNKLNESEWDMGLAIEELKGLSDEMFELTGFDKDLLIEPDEKDDEIPENAPPVAKLGDIWALGRHRLMCGDSTSKEAVERLMGGVLADLVVTDPPYGMNLETDYTLRNSTHKSYNGLGTKYGTRGKYSKVIGDDKPYNPEHIFRDFDYCKEIFLWGADYYSEVIPNRMEGSWYSWDKRVGIEDIKFTASEFELCWSKKKHLREILRVRWFGAHGTQTQDVKKRSHPTQKPIEVNTFFIQKFSKENAIIVDLFGGSGSTLIACEKTNRTCYMMELDEKYVSVILQRWADYTGQDPIREDGKKWSELVPKV